MTSSSLKGIRRQLVDEGNELVHDICDSLALIGNDPGLGVALRRYWHDLSFDVVVPSAEGLGPEEWRAAVRRATDEDTDRIEAFVLWAREIRGQAAEAAYRFARKEDVAPLLLPLAEGVAKSSTLKESPAELLGSLLGRTVEEPSPREAVEVGVATYRDAERPPRPKERPRRPEEGEAASKAGPPASLYSRLFSDPGPVILFATALAAAPLGALGWFGVVGAMLLLTLGFAVERVVSTSEARAPRSASRELRATDSTSTQAARLRVEALPVGQDISILESEEVECEEDRERVKQA